MRKLQFTPIVCSLILLQILMVQCSRREPLPEQWRQEWSDPPARYRPLQIVHGADIRNKAAYYKDSCGLGGVVCNVPFGENYLKSESDWRIYAKGVKAMVDNGLRVWIYDEDGYPSLGAGGRVLEADRTLEALEMVYDSAATSPFTTRPCYEFTHACNNFYVARRYPDPLNPASTERFIGLTHQAYYTHLGAGLFGQVEAFFTDEPSMMGVNLGELREDVRKNVRVTDPTDPTKRNLPMVSWSPDLPGQYKARYDEELLPVVASLFTGTAEKDKSVRQKFWSLLAELDRKNYYDAIRNWSKSMREKNGGKGPVSSGHGLREENPANHVALDGNKLLVNSGFDLPGLDQLNSDPSIWSGSSWMAVFFPNSSAALTNQRRVMCEMSDFDQTLNGKGPVALLSMQAATAWQMAFGVTDLTLYYTINYGDKYPFRNEASYKEYCNFVGRVNSLLMEAAPVRKTLLYYPIYDLQREYIPTAEKMRLSTQSELTKTIETSFRELGANLLKSQTQFVLVDYLTLQGAVVNTAGTIRIGQNDYSSLSFPKGVTLTPHLLKLINQAKTNGVKVVMADDFKETPQPDQLSKLVGSAEQLIPSDSRIAFGRFTRGGRAIYMLVNTGTDSYHGQLEVRQGTRFMEADPQTGAISTAQKVPGNRIPLDVAPLQTKLITVL